MKVAPFLQRIVTGSERVRGTISNAVLSYGGLAMLVGATYPLALLGHFAVDVAFGEAEILRDLTYGYRRVLAAALARAWAGSLIWVVAFWALLELSSRILPPVARAAAFIATAVLVAASVARLVPVPTMFGWLLLASLTLHAVYRCAHTKLVQGGRHANRAAVSFYPRGDRHRSRGL